MKKFLIGSAIVIVALAIGVGAAYGVNMLIGSRKVTTVTTISQLPKDVVPQNPKTGNPQTVPQGPQNPGYNNRGFDNRGYYGNGMGPGMMGRNNRNYNQQNKQNNGERISLDKALEQAQSYTTSVGDNFKVVEIMEFSNNFYAAVVEKDSGKGAFELLVDPYTGQVTSEMGPNMMWNLKYGHMRRGQSTIQDNTVSLDQAKDAAQKALDSQIPGATVKADGMTFYGYYTFDYKVNGNIAGMISVNGFNSQVWLHTWHGQFITEKVVQ